MPERRRTADAFLKFGHKDRAAPMGGASGRRAADGPGLKEVAPVLEVRIHVGHPLAVSVENLGGPALPGAQHPLGRSKAGFTLAQKPYSVGAARSQKVLGRFSVNSMETSDFPLLKPYFQGRTRRMGAPCCWGRGLP